jgi:flagellar assembly protein FliH
MGAEPFAFDQFTPPVARGEVTDPLAVAAAELEALRSAAVAEGRAAGRAEALAAVAPVLAALEAASAQVAAESAVLAERLEADAVELALAIAERVVAGTLAAEPERVL